ncbi:MAG: hypothetical protein SOV59_08435 [Fusobacterium mortiferum]|nr:hypothetical protein [Fusobacterium mortiferum]
MEEITRMNNVQENKTEKIITEEIITEEKELSEKEKKYQEILEKKSNKKRLSVEEKILLKEMELTHLRTTLSEQVKKEKGTWTKKIFRILKPEIEKFYDKEQENLDLKIVSLILKTLENYEKEADSINIEEYFVKNKNRWVKIKKEM